MGRREEPIPALSSGLSHVMLTGLLLAVALPLHPPSQHREAPEAARGGSARLAAPDPSAPATGPSEAASVAEPDVWSEIEVTQAREQCMHLLSGVPAEIDYLEPIRKGPCGLPAPVALKSVGSVSRVVFDPPVQVNCRMAAALAEWVKGTLQPQARKNLRSEVVRIIGASGYVCRNIYNRPNAKLSQHALANAVDVSAFGLANGRTIRVLKGWGLTARDIKARAEAREKAKKEAEAKALAAAKAVGKGGTDKPAPSRPATDTATGQHEPAGGMAKRASLMAQASAALPSRPAPTAAATAADGEETQMPAKPTKEALFLRSIHQGACSEFGTVLGPEANDPHRNHFHLDLIARRGRGYCR